MSGLRPAIISGYLSLGPRVGRLTHRALSAMSKERRTLEFYWAAACPYSYLMARQLDAMLGASPVPLAIRPVPVAANDVNPSPELRASHGPRDCAALARLYEVDFPSSWQLPTDDLVARAERAVTHTPTLRRCIEVGGALWSKAGSSESAALEGLPLADEAETRRRLAANAARQRATGHYVPGALRYLGEWFEGPMRLPLVARTLKSDGWSAAEPMRRRKTIDLPQAAPGTPLEVWFSFRSPYSYLAVYQLQQWQRQLPRDDASFAVRLRPVLPMVMRGLAVPRAKKMYLVKDAAREARRLGIPFGRIADPVGDGARRCLAVCAGVLNGDTGNRDADSRNARDARVFDFAVSAARGIWSEGIDVATDRGLFQVAERVGITRDDVASALGAMDEGAALADANRKLLTDELGLWGVPSFRVGDALVIWGQDRLDLIRHVLGLPLEAEVSLPSSTQS